MKIRFRDKRFKDERVTKKILAGRQRIRRYRIALAVSILLNIAAGYHIFNNL